MTGDLPRRAIWLNSDGRSLSVIDQTLQTLLAMGA